MLEASRTQPAGVRFSGFFEITFLHRRWHEARMEQKQNCKIQYGLKTCTAEHSVREGRGGWGESAPPQSPGGLPGPEPPRRPPTAIGRRRQGTRGDCGEPLIPPNPPPPSLPLSSPPQARGRPEAGRRDGGPAPPRGGLGTQGGDATAGARAAARQAPPVDHPLTPALPAADRRLCTGAVGCNGTAAPRNVQTKRPA